MNPSTNGHSNTIARIERLLADYEAKAAALRTTIAILTSGTGTLTTQTKSKPPSEQFGPLKGSITAGDDAGTAVPKRRGPGRPKRQPASHKDRLAHQRQASAHLLSVFSTTPMSMDELRAAGLDTEAIRKLGGLLRHGYLKKKHEGWVRTSKEFVP
jgi:hypothetical protein